MRPRLFKMFTLTTALCVALVAVPVVAKPQQQEDVSPVDVRLTEHQRQELAALHRHLLHTKKQLIAKYMEFGVITPDRARKWSERLDEHYAKMEKHGFVPHWKDGKKDWHKMKRE